MMVRIFDSPGLCGFCFIFCIILLLMSDYPYFPTLWKLFSSATDLDLPHQSFLVVCIYFVDIAEWDILLFYLVAASFYIK